MDRSQRTSRLARWVFAAALAASLVGPLGAEAQRGPDLLPSVEQDDAARLVRAGDFRETEDLVTGYGAVWGPADYAGTYGDEPPETGVFAGLDFDERVEVLEELGWLSISQLNFGVPRDDDSGDFAAYLLSSITRFESPDAAEAAFEVLEDESEIRGVEDQEAPGSFGSLSEITVAEVGGRLNRNLTFVVDDAHLNVFVDAPEDDPIFTEDLLVEAGELLAERLELDADELPGLAPIILRVASDGETVLVYEEEYQALDGDAPRDFYDSDEEFEFRSDQWRDIVHVYSYLAGFQPDGSVVARLYQAEDVDAAEGLMESLEENPAPGFYATWDLIDDGAEVGDASLTAAFTYVLDDVEYQGYAVVFQLDDIVARVEIDAGEDVGIEPVIEIAEAQLACIEEGGCEPFKLPADLSGGGSDDEGDPLGPVDDQEA